MFIGEAQVGLEWDYALQQMPANACIRIGFEFQNWTTSGNVNGTPDSYAGAIGGLTIDAAGRVGNASTDLVGFNIGAGDLVAAPPATAHSR